MAQLRRRLPPVNSMVVLEAAGRLLNFTRAGEELGLTQSAVSRQIQLLEEHLGAPMFQRQGRNLQLTRDGVRLHRSVTMGLGHVADTAVDIRRHRGTGELTVATSVTFANYWLMARLAQFRAQHPDIELRLVASTKLHDLVAAGVDIAIRYGSGGWDGLDAIRIFDNEIWPVCAPAYLDGRPSLAKVEDLLDETLLHLGQFDRNWVTWPAWLAAQGVVEARANAGWSSTTTSSCCRRRSAARASPCAAAGWPRISSSVATWSGRSRPRSHSDRAFYVVHPSEVRLSEAAVRFRDWLVTAAG